MIYCRLVCSQCLQDVTTLRYELAVHHSIYHRCWVVSSCIGNDMIDLTILCTISLDFLSIVHNKPNTLLLLYRFIHFIVKRRSILSPALLLATRNVLSNKSPLITVARDALFSRAFDSSTLFGNIRLACTHHVRVSYLLSVMSKTPRTELLNLYDQL